MRLASDGLNVQYPDQNLQGVDELFVGRLPVGSIAGDVVGLRSFIVPTDLTGGVGSSSPTSFSISVRCSPTGDSV